MIDCSHFRNNVRYRLCIQRLMIQYPMTIQYAMAMWFFYCLMTIFPNSNGHLSFLPLFFAAFSEALHQQQLATSQTDPHLSSTAASLMGSAAIEQNATGKMDMPARSKFLILYIIP